MTKVFLDLCPEVLEKNKISIRYKSGFPQRVEYDNRLFKKILNN